jgi:hypothetical protein
MLQLSTTDYGLHSEPDVQNFDLLIEDMECLVRSWGDLGFEDALPFLGTARRV